jgi:hypothetical protein
MWDNSRRSTNTTSRSLPNTSARLLHEMVVIRELISPFELCARDGLGMERRETRYMGLNGSEDAGVWY